MNSKAFFTFVLVLAFAFFLLSFNSQNLKFQKNFDSALNSAIALEIASAKRSVAESNTGFLIEKTIERQVFLKQDSPMQITSAINSGLSGYFQQLRLEGFSFYSTEFYLPGYSKLSSQFAIPFLQFSDEFKANVVKLKELTLVEVSFTGGLSGKRLVFAKISPADSVYFIIPFNYSIKKAVVS
ncbi:MAG: hypothetical protein Q7R70_06660 [Candidatus Diapherotrites archaeon]|nr:hypothetical protein [Candidatus Diapherotrites archaeon]